MIFEKKKCTPLSTNQGMRPANSLAQAVRYLPLLSGLLAFPAARAWWRRDRPLASSIVVAGIATFAQHATEPIGNMPPLVAGPARELVFVDRAAAMVVVCASLRFWHLLRMDARAVSLLLASGVLLILSDSGALDHHPLVYCVVHALWHLAIFATIGRLALVVETARRRSAVRYSTATARRGCCEDAKSKGGLCPPTPSRS